LQKIPSVVLLSGGLDSSANLALALEGDASVLLCLHVDYGQRAEASEWRAVQRLSQYYSVRAEKLDLRWLGALGGSSLTDARESVPTLIRSELDDLEKITKTAKSVWVPNRNGVMIQAAAAYAERMGATQVIVGFNREEATTFPDNTGEFLEASSHALSYSTQNHVKVRCFTTDLDKVEICKKLRTLSRPFPFEALWSCYHSGDVPCGTCESCGRLNRALEEST